MWADNSIIYHLYPLGFCEVPLRNDWSGEPVNRIAKVADWLPHIKSLGANTLLLGPIFESTAHGYDTADYFHIDHRLGTDTDFKDVAHQIHEQGFKLILDGVFNHVGRDFWAFKDVLEKRENSIYKNWFTLNFSLNNAYNDGLCYAAWEGCEDLITLNLGNMEVRTHIFSAIRFWVEDYEIDGLRLDVAYCLDLDFIRELREFCDSLKPDFWLMGETLHGNYRRWMNANMLDSVTNYECYKGLWSSCNTHNMFEISHSLDRQFAVEGAGLYSGYHLCNFVDNHDVTRIASKLKDMRHLPLLYTLLFTMPGIPMIYYGSEWGAIARKKEGDVALRCSFAMPYNNKLTDVIRKLAALHHKYIVLREGDYRKLELGNEFLSFERSLAEQKLTICLNIGTQPVESTVEGQKHWIPPVSAFVYENGQCVFAVENFTFKD